MKAVEALRIWTVNSIAYSRPKLQKLQLLASQRLAREKGQSFPKVGYRALFVKPAEMQSWKDFRKFIKDRGLPESYSSTLRGVLQFLKDGGGAAAVRGTAAVVLEVRVSEKDWLFNLGQLIRRLPAAEQRDTAAEYSDMPLTTYLRHDEVVAASGSLLRAIKGDQVKLVGYEVAGNKIKMLPQPKLIGASLLVD